MTTALDCWPCFARQALEAARSVSPDPVVHERILREMLDLAAGADLKQPRPIFAQKMY